MRAVAEVNKYVSDSEPWKLKGDDERERLGTILHVVAQCVADLQHDPLAVPAVLGQRRRRGPRRHRARCSRCRGSQEVDDLDGGAGYPVLTGDYSGARPAGSGVPIEVGTAVAKPAPVFTKLDPAVVDEELQRLASGE